MGQSETEINDNEWVFHIYQQCRTEELPSDETDCISHSTNTLGNGMNPNILPPAMGR